MRAFFLSVTAGTLAAAWLPLIFTTLIALNTLAVGLDGDSNVTGSILLAISPAIVALAFVLPAAVFIGLPVTALLVRLQRESISAYTSIGMGSGFMLPLAVIWVTGSQEGWWMSLLGAFSGAITGRTWWTLAREGLAS